MEDLVENLLDYLSENNDLINILTEFKLKKSNAERVDYISKHLNDLNSIDIKNQQITNGKKSMKCNKKSVQFCQSGDKWFNKKSNHFEALVNYNESICFAEPESKELAYGYGKRSAIYFEWSMYDLCLNNIQLARTTLTKDKLSDSFCSELLTLETECINRVKNNKKSKNLLDVVDVVQPKLSLPSHSQVPFIVNCLDIRENEKYGRYIITHETLYPGQIVAIEEKYFNILLPKLCHQRCANCLRENFLSLIACPECTLAMFCSVGCLKKAQSTYHQYECPIIDYLYENCNRFHLSALRSTLMAFVSYQKTSELSNGLQNADKNSPVTSFTINHRKKTTSVEKYLQIYTFPTKQVNRTVTDLFGTASVAAVLVDQLLNNTKLGELLLKSNEQTVLKELLFKHLQITRMYFHSISSSDKQYRSDGGQGGLIGSGAYPFCSLINHACTPNIMRIPFGSKMVIFVLRIIKPGEQLFDNYGSHHYTEKLKSRQDSMIRNYLFTCECDACINDYPQFNELLEKNLPPIISQQDRIQLQEVGNRLYAAKNYERLAKYLNQYDSFYPCKEIYLVQHYLRESLHLWAGNLSIRQQMSLPKTLNK